MEILRALRPVTDGQELRLETVRVLAEIYAKIFLRLIFHKRIFEFEWEHDQYMKLRVEDGAEHVPVNVAKYPLEEGNIGYLVTLRASKGRKLLVNIVTDSETATQSYGGYRIESFHCIHPENELQVYLDYDYHFGWHKIKSGQFVDRTFDKIIKATIDINGFLVETKSCV